MSMENTSRIMERKSVEGRHEEANRKETSWPGVFGGDAGREEEEETA